MESHLLQMRGLKRIISECNKKRRRVASFTDAWIETIWKESLVKTHVSHLLQMRGLKLCTKE